MTANTKIQQKTTSIISKTGPSHWSAIPDISGIAPIGPDAYLVVHDAKAHKVKKARIGLISINRKNEKLAYTQLKFPKTLTPPTSDLEGICRVPNRANEFLVNESGYWEGKYGRVFHIKITGENITIINTMQLPVINGQFEGIACMPASGNSITILLGQRGGNAANPHGAIKWGNYNLGSHQIKWSSNKIPVTAPNPWHSKRLRGITGLSIDKDGTLWASAAIDLDKDLGPFRSLVYTLGKVSKNSTPPVFISANHKVWIMDGIKIEGVTTGFDKASISYGSEDEKLGGIWRELPQTPSLTLPH